MDESSDQPNPRKRVEELALRKAQAIARKLKKGVVLGADTLVVCEGKILGQPKDARHAYDMLYKLAGTTHQVFTGVALVDAVTGRTAVSSAVSRVRMKKLPLERLLALSRQHLDKAGSYAIQEKNDPIAKVVSGSYENVVGLPLDVVKKLLKHLSPTC